MAKPTLADKDFLTPTEAAVFFKLSRRKFYKLLEEGPHNFMAMYGERKLIIKNDFINYLAQPGVKEALARDERHINKKRLKTQNLA
ncbi:MAG: helix-turn-helix domain-containing protein [Lachnospiraceae bacterium]|nr:helix-turn-helix domain-containing protein [Lachnospiraceae bacterium]